MFSFHLGEIKILIFYRPHPEKYKTDALTQYSKLEQSHIYKKQIITDVDISILSEFININLKRLCTEAITCIRDLCPILRAFPDSHVHSFIHSFNKFTECLLCAELDSDVFGAEISALNAGESTKNIPGDLLPKLPGGREGRWEGSRVMGLEPSQSRKQRGQSHPAWLPSL